MLDYDDLLLYWWQMCTEPALAAQVGARFDHVLVDEYQDTNRLQAQILLALKPDGRGLTVVGDDAQSIYSFRAAEVRNILDFPRQFEPAAQVLTLERNYRSTQPILHACNAVIAPGARAFHEEPVERQTRQRQARCWCTVLDDAGQATLGGRPGAGAARGRHRAEAPGGAVSHQPPQRRARTRAAAAQHSRT